LLSGQHEADVIWRYDLKAHVWPGGTIVADGKVYVGDEDGDLVVLAVQREKKVIGEWNLQGPIYSTPVVANNVPYIHSATHLFAFGLKAAVSPVN
jgi:outer membrane protein assembly factor BamB